MSTWLWAASAARVVLPLDDGEVGDEEIGVSDRPNAPEFLVVAGDEVVEPGLEPFGGGTISVRCL